VCAPFSFLRESAVGGRSDGHRRPSPALPLPAAMRANWSGNAVVTSRTGGAAFDYLQWVCQFKGATLSGRFSPDLSSFEAEGALIWGAPGAETVVRRRWVERRL
jgi:hypothetical protein